MPVYFVDSSALVKRYRFEEGSERLAELLDQAERLIASRLTQVEVSSAIVRRGRTTGASMLEVTRVLAIIDRDMRDSFHVIELDAPIIEQALALTRKHGLRAADAIQLACAIVARSDAPQQAFIMLASDQELNAAAEAEAVPVLDPTRL